MGNLATDQIAADSAAIGRDNAALGVLAINSDPTGAARIDFYSDSVLRWNMIKSGTESGSEAGADISVNSYDDDGLLIDSVVTLVRAAGEAIQIGRPLELLPDEDTYSVIGRCFIGSTNASLSDVAVFGHYDYLNSLTAYGFRQNANGQTIVNGKTGTSMLFRINNATVMSMSSTALTMTGALLVRSVTDAGPMTATPGTQREIVFNTSDSKYYGCTVTHGTAATWVALN